MGKKLEFGKIYKITSLKSGRIYVGSTTDPLTKRYNSHKSGYMTYRECVIGGKYCTSYEIFADDYPELPEITLIERYPCQKLIELHSREAYHILTSNCVNHYVPVRSNWRAILEGMRENELDKTTLDELARKDPLRSKVDPDKIIDIF